MNATPEPDPLERITDFAVAHGANGCFVGWDREFVRQYIAFHAGQNTLAVVHDRGEPVAMGTAIQCDPEQIGERWNWKPTNPHGQVLLILDVISTRAGAMSLLFLKMFRLWPPGSVKRILALRPSGPREISSRYMALTAQR
jgi:hypothetical protein